MVEQWVVVPLVWVRFPVLAPLLHFFNSLETKTREQQNVKLYNLLSF